MATQDGRNEYTSKLMSKLLKSIAGVKNDDKSLSRHEQLAWNIVRIHRGISTNRHEVKRKIDELKERFVVDNFQEYGDHLERLSNDVVNHPLCLKHYQVDIHWSLLDFLTLIAYNPTGALRRRQTKLLLPSPELSLEENSVDLEELELKNELKENFIPLTNYDENSDLSEWSEDENTEGNELQKVQNVSLKQQKPISPVVIAPGLPALKPPVKQVQYEIIIPPHDLKDRMKQSIQHSWWLGNEASESKEKITSYNNEANFALLFSNFVPNHLDRFKNLRQPLVKSDFCFLRELLWLFITPEKCTFFTTDSDRIRIKNGVTMRSITAPSLAAYMEHHFLHNIDRFQTLYNFFNTVMNSQHRYLSKTYECYAANLKSLLEPIIEKIVVAEDHMVKQRQCELNTLIDLQAKLRETFKNLQVLHSIHEAVTQDFRKYPAHISSSFLLAALIQFSNGAFKPIESNLAISLFLTSIKAFCSIIDSWWNEGRLDDWQEEFVVECNAEQNISLRLYSKDKEKAFFVPKQISKIIEENSFIRLLLAHSMEVGHTLNLLYEISRIGDLRNDCKAIEGNLYEAFIDDILYQIRSLGVVSKDTSKSIDQTDRLSKETDVVDKHKQPSVQSENLNSQLTTKDEFLLLLFKSNDQRSVDVRDCANCYRDTRNALDLYNELKQYDQILPFEELIVNSFSRLLRERISLANMFVVKLFREEFGILMHLGNVRKVLLLEASDLMSDFYTKLFKQIEAGQSWANAFVLTMQLDETLSNRYPEMSSNFRIEIHSAASAHTNKVTEAVEAFSINYNFGSELTKIISEVDMKTYNEVFRFLLKVKWALATLESLSFVRERHRPLYAPMILADFCMRRLEQLRFWMFYAVQCIHSHLMMHVLQSMGTQLDDEIKRCTNVREMEMVHKSYLATILEHCFLKDNLSRIKIGIEQLLNLVFILRFEYRSCLKYFNKSNPLSLEDSDSDDLEFEDYMITASIDEVQSTYVRCHEYLANILKNEVYMHQHSFLSGLCAAFNTSLPC